LFIDISTQSNKSNSRKINKIKAIKFTRKILKNKSNTDFFLNIIIEIHMWIYTLNSVNPTIIWMLYQIKIKYYT